MTSVVVERLAKAYGKFYSKKGGRPKFKSKKNLVDSYTTKCVNENIQIVHTQRKYTEPQKTKKLSAKLQKKQKSIYKKRMEFHQLFLELTKERTVTRIKLPKIGEVNIKLSRPVEGKIKTVTVTKTGSGKYFVSLVCQKSIKELPKINKVVGIDVGLKDFATLSTGEKFENPKWLRKSEAKLKKLQQELSRKK